MTPANQAILDDLAAKVTAARTAYNDQKSRVDAGSVQAKIYEAQGQAFRDAGDIERAEMIAGLLTTHYANLTIQGNILKSLEAAYNAALAAYQDAQNTILSEPEKKEIEITAQANAAVAQANAEAAAVKAKAEASANYAASSAKWVIIIAVVLTVATIVYFKVRKNASA